MAEMEGGYQILMNKFMILLILCVVFFGCQFDIKKTNTQKEAVEIVMAKPVRVDTTSRPDEQNNNHGALKKVINFIPDIAINKKLFLEDDKSIFNFYSKKKPLILIEKLRQSPVIIFGNNSSKEYLLAYQYEGNTKNTYSCFEIGYFEDDKSISIKQSNQTKETNFKTESGLFLGLSLEDVIRIKGLGYELEKSGGYIILNYKIEDYESSAFLKKYNMPGYFIEFRLKNNIVKKITFGFDYP